MTFIWMEALWLLLLVPLLAGAYVWLMRRKKKAAIRYANLTLVKQAMGRGAPWRRHLPPVLLLLALTILILAIARPAAVMTLPSNRATVMLAMDVSGSMRADDITPTRIEAAQKAAKQFIADLPGEVQIGIVAFASSAMLVQVPTIDRTALDAAIDRFQLRYGTAIGDGILESLATIFPNDKFDVTPDDGSGNSGTIASNGNGSTVSGGYQSRSLDDQTNTTPAAEHVPVKPGSYQNAVIVLLTDGAATTGMDPVQAGQIAANYGVRVYTVGFGTLEGSVLHFGGFSMRARPDPDTLRKIADTTDAQFFDAQSANELTNVYKSLSAKLTSEHKLTEISFIFAGIGALFVMLAAGLSMLWFGRVA